jgi:hypothetical protein
MKRYKLQPYRRKSRKIGRNEPCPCGRIRETDAIDEDHLKHAEFSRVQSNAASNIDDTTFKTVARVPMKYKNCCGDPDNQRSMRAVQYHISSFINRLVAKRKKKSFISKLAGFFKRDKLEKDNLNDVRTKNNNIV